MGKEGISIFRSRYRFRVGAFGKDEAIASDDDGAASADKLWDACCVVADDLSTNW
jgi:hypothetical protein